jgi:inner membrane protein
MESLGLSWWLWMLIGLAFLAGELLTPGGFFLVFFGVSAGLVGVLALFGLQSPALQGLVFAVVTVVALLFFRKPLLAKFRKLSPEHTVDALSQGEALALQEIAPQATGQVELRGTVWSATNVSDMPILKSQRCHVEQAQGLTLLVRPL